MEGLQRSEISFRRQGSSGLVWDDKFFSGELNKLSDKQNEENRNKKADSNPSAAGLTIERSQSTGAGRRYPPLDDDDPPSPRVSACGLCAAFGNARRRRKSNKKRA